MAIQTLPNNVPNCLATLLSLVDDICYHTGDRSVDVSNSLKENLFFRLDVGYLCKSYKQRQTLLDNTASTEKLLS